MERRKSNNGIIRRFLKNCLSLKLSQHTLRAYSRALVDFHNGFVRINDHPEHTKKGDVNRYIESMSANGLSATTIRARISALSSFFEWAISVEIMGSNPAKAVRKPKVPSRIPEYVPQTHLSEIIEAVDGKDFISLRNRAILETGYAGTCRIGDLQSADLKNLNLREKTLTVIRKGNVEKALLLGESAILALKNYLTKRREEKCGLECPALFVNTDGSRLMTIGRIIKDITGFAPHVFFRHSGATHALQNGADIRVVQHLLGHGSLSSTSVYLGTTDEHTRAMYDAFYPRASTQTPILSRRSQRNGSAKRKHTPR